MGPLNSIMKRRIYDNLLLMNVAKNLDDENEEEGET
jgi:hypothetical protein